MSLRQIAEFNMLLFEQNCYRLVYVVDYDEADGLHTVSIPCRLDNIEINLIVDRDGTIRF